MNPEQIRRELRVMRATGLRCRTREAELAGAALEELDRLNRVVHDSMLALVEAGIQIDLPRGKR